jgi:hypothetical protein
MYTSLREGIKGNGLYHVAQEGGEWSKDEELNSYNIN